MSEPEKNGHKWLDWARLLHAHAHNGLTYSDNPYERDRYEQILQIAAEIMAEGAGEPVERVREFFSGEEGYLTPKVDVRGAAFREGRVLLVRERMDGCWCLPGGYADIGDSPRRAVEREMFEESGFETRATRLVGLYDLQTRINRPPHPRHIYKLFFLCEITGGEAAVSHETTEVGFIAEDEIPELSRGRTSRQQLARMFDFHRNPDRAADFE